MPRRPRQPRRKLYKRKYKRKSNRIQTSVIRAPASIVADRTIVKLKYSETVAHNFGALTGAYYFNANSLFDPNRSGTGHQPMGFDELSGLYNRYRVRGVSLKMTVGDCSTPVMIAIHAINGSAGAPTYDDAAEQPYAKSMTVSATGGADLKSKSLYMDMKKLLGRPTLDSRDEATFNQSPTEVAMIGAFFETFDQATNMTTIVARYDLVYYCEMFDRKILGGS